MDLPRRGKPGGQAGSTSEHSSHPSVELVAVPYRPHGQISQRTDGRTDLPRRGKDAGPGSPRVSHINWRGSVVHQVAQDRDLTKSA
jgi:hypothetical protein